MSNVRRSAEGLGTLTMIAMATTAKSGKRSLKEYHRKRNFSSTPEPRGDASRDAKRAAKVKKLFFCVQKHLASHLHYDFRL